jgi:hypothetical protein
MAKKIVIAKADGLYDHGPNFHKYVMSLPGVEFVNTNNPHGPQIYHFPQGITLEHVLHSNCREGNKFGLVATVTLYGEKGWQEVAELIKAGEELFPEMERIGHFIDGKVERSESGGLKWKREITDVM